MALGCSSTAQGFEFNYIGVIVGRDLRRDPASDEWTGMTRGSRQGKNHGSPKASSLGA